MAAYSNSKDFRDRETPRAVDPLKDALDNFHAAAMAHRNARVNSEVSAKQLQEAISQWQDAEEKLRALVNEEYPHELRPQTASSAILGRGEKRLS
jgi:hypothetical protein